MNRKKTKVFLATILTSLLLLSGCSKERLKLTQEVTKWDNLYEGNNIHFYYEDFTNTQIEELNRLYKLKGTIGSQGDELERALKVSEWLHTKMEYNQGAISTKEDALEILNEKESSPKASDREFSIVFNQVCSALGIYGRIGVFRVKYAEIAKGRDYYRVNEIWSEKLNKWIMVDPSKGVYITKEDIPLSAMEIIESNLDNVEVKGIKDSKDYIKNFKDYTYSYTINIDNTIYGRKRSNSFITYLPEGEMPELKLKQGYAPPTIYVNNRALFNISPKDEYVDDKSDKIPTMIIMKKVTEEDKGDDKTFVIGVFQNSVMVDDYYLKVNDEEWERVKRYKEIALKEGSNTISLSLDGKEIIREIAINKKQ
ncbi:MAG: transglutaminase domain-containing protein [Clostridia bacterium]|nr:transglutaminase domain-containing protein [Clostridia bacterium]